VAHIDESKSLASTEHGENTVDAQIGSENETGTILFMLESPEGDADDKTNDGA